MQFQGAVIKEQGLVFGIVVVKPHVIQNQTESDNMRNFGVRAFGIMPIVLACQNGQGRFTYYGRPDIAKFLASISPSRIPWKRYTID